MHQMPSPSRQNQNTWLDSINFINLFQYVTWDQICLTMSLPSLKPACSFLSLWSTLPCILLIRIFPSTLLVIGSSITPLQFLHCCRFPFFRILHIRPSFYFSCSFSSCQVRSKRCVSSMQVRSVSAFNSSAVIWSIPGAFPFLKVCITLLISSSVGGYVLMPSFPLLRFLIRWWVWWCLPFQESLKVLLSFHLAYISSLLLRGFQSLLAIAAVFSPLQLSCLVKSYNSLAFPFSAAVCAA